MLLILIISTSEALQEHWCSPIYTFFKSNIVFQYHNGQPSHFFACAAPKCMSHRPFILNMKVKYFASFLISLSFWRYAKLIQEYTTTNASLVTHRCHNGKILEHFGLTERIHIVNADNATSNDMQITKLHQLDNTELSLMLQPHLTAICQGPLETSQHRPLQEGDR